MMPRNAASRTWKRLFTDHAGMAVIEFAISLPFVVLVTMGGAELTNYTTTKMRMSQIALMVADNASRVGTGTVLSNKTISEKQINDLLTGAGLQADKLKLFTKGRVIIRSLQPGATATQYVVQWERCKGMKSYTPTTYPAATPTTQHTISGNPFKVTPPSNGAVIFVEIVYDYQPLLGSQFIDISEIRETAAMTVRDNRDYAGGTNGIYNAEGVTASSCSVYSAS
tara:strand:+ start:2968 stop:3642 length:675 start_codon:yes stop_codon:yes gene_type:complete